MDEFSSYNYKEMYQQLGLSIQRLGCIMADTEEIKVSHIVDDSWLYYAQNPDKYKYIDGVVSEKVPHATLLYGLIRSGTEMKDHVDTVLDGGRILPDMVEISEVSYFGSSMNDEQYYCIIAKLNVTDELMNCHLPIVTGKHGLSFQFRF